MSSFNIENDITAIENNEKSRVRKNLFRKNLKNRNFDLKIRWFRAEFRPTYI